MDMLALFKLVDSFHGLTLCSQIYHITHQIPAAQCMKAWRVWGLTSFEYLQNTVSPMLLVSGF